MPVRQYAYFALSGHVTSADEMTAVLGIEPDRTAIRGSRRAEPSAVKRAHDPEASGPGEHSLMRH